MHVQIYWSSTLDRVSIYLHILDLGVINYSKEIHEDPDRIYETIKDNGNNEVPPNQLGTSSDTYSYADSNIVSIPASTEQEYTYANDTDSPRSSYSVGAKPAAKGPVRNGAVYETLEQPGQMTDDDFYNYPNNTKIANQGPTVHCIIHWKNQIHLKHLFIQRWKNQKM